MRIHPCFRPAMFILTGALCLSFHTACASTATWITTSDQSIGNWTDTANWNAAQYPGQDAANQNAYLTNRLPNASYTAVVDTTLPYSVGTVEIKNPGDDGEACVIVTNAVLTYTNLFIRTGGRLQIDNLGVVTNAPGFANGIGFTMDGTNGQLLISSGGSLFASTNSFLGSGSGGKNNVLTLGDNAFCAVTNGSLNMGSGTGADGNRLLVPGDNVRIRTTVNPLVFGSGSANNLALFTGTNIVWTYGNSSQMRVGQQAGGNSNTLMVFQGSLSLLGSTLNIGLSGGASYNALIVTNGGRFYTRSTVGAGYNTSNNLILVTGSGSLWDGGGAHEKSGDTGGCYNRLEVDDNGTVTNAYLSVGIGNASNNGNTLVLKNGARWLGGAGGDSYIGYGGVSNTAWVTGPNTLWNLSGRTLYVGSSSTNTSYCSVTIDTGAVITNGPFIVGPSLFATQNSLVVTNGGQLFTGTSASIVGNPASNNLVLVTGAGSLWNGGLQDVRIGSSASALNNTLRIEESARVENVGNFYVGNSKAANNTMTVTKGGQCWVTATKSFYVGNVASSNSVLVSGSGSALNNLSGGNLFVGGTQFACSNLFAVSDSAESLGWAQMYVGRFSNCTENVLLITKGGVVQGSQIRLCYQGSNAWNNSVQVYDGGLLEVSGSGFLVDQSAMGPVGNNCISNRGGIYQFTSATPTITPVPANNSFVTLTDGTISFRGVTGVNVKGNWTGNLTNILFFGTRNAFRLNNATNTTLTDQTYTFTDTLGPTNYARLELFNGSLYRSGSVTIGSGGTLAFSGAPSTITNLTIASGGTLEVAVSGTTSASQLNAVGSVTLGGMLQLTLTEPPPPAGFDWTLISKSGASGITGQFDGGTKIEAAYQGTNYAFRVYTAGGDGNDLALRSLGISMTGTMILVF